MRRHFRAFGQDCRVDVGDLEPSLFEQAADVAQKYEAVVRHRGSRSEKCEPISPSAAAPSSASVITLRQAVSVGMAEQPTLMGDFDPAEDQLATFDQAVDVISYARAKLALNVSAYALKSFSARARSSGVVILMLFAMPSTTATGAPRRSTRNESSVASAGGKSEARASSLARISRS